MDSAGASLSPVKSNKILRSSANKTHSSGEAPDQNLWSSKTPEKPVHLPRRVLTRRQTLQSVNQVKEAAKRLRISDQKTSVSSDRLTSSADPTAIRITKPKTSEPLPDKCEMLNKFFHSLGSSIRLLGLKGCMSTFTNIRRQVEILTDRSFGYRHLAQLKFILPEAIEMKKILVRDDRTCCMKPDLHITLNFSIVQNDEKMTSDSANVLMNKLFRSRLLSFYKSNPEGDEVPEEKLPEPFNRSSRSSSDSIQKPDLETTYPAHEQQPFAASHMPQSFKKRFSKQVFSRNVDTEFMVPTPEAQVDHGSFKVARPSLNDPSPLKWYAKLPETPIKGSDLGKEDHSCIDETPIKPISTPYGVTPAQLEQPPVRWFMTPDEESTSKLTRRASAKRLTYDDDDLSDILSHDLLASIKQKELNALEEKNPDISQAKRRKQMIARLPKLFDKLLFFFQSTKRTVITKQQLVNMISSNGLEIVDPNEIDEQLRLLQELAPEWIHEKIASSGDHLFCVSKISNPELIRTRLSENEFK
ncbi:hypothetical protein R6Q57_002667 [Mikania cordata]